MLFLFARVCRAWDKVVTPLTTGSDNSLLAAKNELNRRIETSRFVMVISTC